MRAIVREHGDRIELIRADLVADATGTEDLRTWIGCLVQPFTGHLASLDPPTWYARFNIQVAADPALREIAQEETLTSPSLRLLVAYLTHRVLGPPPPLRAERLTMARHLIDNMCADYERVLAENDDPQPAWDGLATRLADAIIGLWQAPIAE